MAADVRLLFDCMHQITADDQDRHEISVLALLE
jgi:hypothetical protein